MPNQCIWNFQAVDISFILNSYQETWIMRSHKLSMKGSVFCYPKFLVWKLDCRKFRQKTSLKHWKLIHFSSNRLKSNFSYFCLVFAQQYYSLCLEFVPELSNDATAEPPANVRQLCPELLKSVISLQFSQKQIRSDSNRLSFKFLRLANLNR